MERQIIHLHIPAFAVAVEEVCRPGLKGRPVAVAVPRSDRAPVLCVSQEARRQGVFKGMPFMAARKRCPDLLRLPPNPDLVDRAWRALTGITGRYTPLWEPFRPGHVYLDMTGTGRLWGRARDAGQRLEREVRTRTRLAGSVGLAGNKLVSSIASRVQGRPGLLDVHHGLEAAFMAPLPVDMVPGIGPVRRKILLEELRIRRAGELASLDDGALRLIFGGRAHVIRQRVLGIDPTPVRSEAARPVVSAGVSLPGDDNDDDRLLGVLARLVEACAARLREKALRPRRAGLMIRYGDLEEVHRQMKLPVHSWWEFELNPWMERLFRKAASRRVGIRAMGVWFRDFAPESGQLSLFPEAAPQKEKACDLVRALERIRGRYGADAVRRARLPLQGDLGGVREGA